MLPIERILPRVVMNSRGQFYHFFFSLATWNGNAMKKTLALVIQKVSRAVHSRDDAWHRLTMRLKGKD